MRVGASGRPASSCQPHGPVKLPLGLLTPCIELLRAARPRLTRGSRDIALGRVDSKTAPPTERLEHALSDQRDRRKPLAGPGHSRQRGLKLQLDDGLPGHHASKTGFLPVMRRRQWNDHAVDDLPQGIKRVPIGRSVAMAGRRLGQRDPVIEVEVDDRHPRR